MDGNRRSGRTGRSLMIDTPLRRLDMRAGTAALLFEGRAQSPRGLLETIANLGLRSRTS